MSDVMHPDLLKSSFFRGSKRGQSLAEYTLILAFITLTAVALLSVIGPQLRSIYGSISSALSTTQSTIGPHGAKF